VPASRIEIREIPDVHAASNWKIEIIDCAVDCLSRLRAHRQYSRHCGCGQSHQDLRFGNGSATLQVRSISRLSNQVVWTAS
jgi:hypothetical protein